MRSARAMPAAVKARIDAIRAEAEEEYRRLLYVAMTRARDRLYVCGTLKPKATDMKAGWHALVTSALEAECVRSETADGIVTLEWRPAPPAAPPKGKQEAMTYAPPRPAWLTQPAPPAPAAIRRITPSTALGGASAAPAPVRSRLLKPGGEILIAIERGRLVHRLLQSLPEIAPERRREIGGRYLEAVATEWPEADRAALLDEVLRILADPGFAPVFAPGSRAEVEIAGRIGAATLSGRIDRLAVTAERVLVVDYKTNRPAPESLADAPHDYVMQLALYRAVLRRLYSGKPVAAAILWTDRPALMEVPAAILDAAENWAVAATPESQPGPASGGGLSP
jgi:ATP-dependent helicase/nuclease subunit A